MTEEELQELETLRTEKKTREQQSRAASALAGAGVPESFAPLLSGSDDTDTDGRVQAFCAAYRSALTEDIRLRLPERAPVMTPPAPPYPRRGIQRIR